MRHRHFFYFRPFDLRRTPEFKIPLLIFESIKTERSTYLHELFTLVQTVRHTRLSKHNILDDKVVLTEFSSRAFCHAAPTVWNSLPHNITDDYN